MKYKNTKERNMFIKKYIEEKLNEASNKNNSDFQEIPDYIQLRKILKDLIFVKTRGFRGLVITAIAGKKINNLYEPLKNFYDCNPRAIFENAIYYALKNKIPCGKSDPLNVAKNTNLLNEEWAKGKRPYKSAIAVVNYLNFLENAEEKFKEKIIDFFFFKLIEYSNTIKEIKIENPIKNNTNNINFSSKIYQFISENQEGGVIPQFFISKMIEEIYSENSIFKIKGLNESVFSTNTTSKKPADVWLEINNVPVNLFEITLKPVNYKRLDDCLESLNEQKIIDKKVNFICRIPEDIKELDCNNNIVDYQNKSFYFIDMSDFISSITILISEEQINSLILSFFNFINSIECSIETKHNWNKIFKN